MPNHCDRCSSRLRPSSVERRAQHALGVFALVLSSGCAEAEHSLGGAPIGSQGFRQNGLDVSLCRNGGDVELVDSMEDNDYTIELVEGRSGSWFSFNDDTMSAVQEPKPGSPVFPMVPREPEVEGSRYSAFTAGSGFRNWGAGIGFELQSGKPYDASRYPGIAFWARTRGERPLQIRADVTDRNTSPAGRVCEYPTLDRSKECYDNFGSEVTLTSEWKYFQLDWSELTQQGFATPQDAVVTSELYGLRFQVLVAQANPRFEFWIDDVVFLCR